MEFDIMKIPNYENALIPVEKIRDYLLSRLHPIGKAKATFFNNIGYYQENLDLLIEDLYFIVKHNEVQDIIKSSFGMKYIIKGNIGSRFDKNVEIITIWIIDDNNTYPRFITAYPCSQGGIESDT